MPPACSIVILQPSDDIVFCHSCSGQKSSNKWLQRVPDTLQEQPAVLYCSGLLFEGERAFPRAGSDYLFAKSTSRCNPAPRQCGCCTPPRTSRRPIIAGCLCSWLQRPPWNSQELHGDWLLICNPTGWLHLICNPTRGRSSPLGGWLHYSVPSRTIWLQRRRLSQTKIKSLAQHWTLTSIGWNRNRNRLSSINPVSHCP